MYGPVLRGQLALMRPPRLEEATAMSAWFEDLEVTAAILRRFPPGLQGEEDWLRHAAADPNSINWAVEHEGRLVGTTGVHQIDWLNGFGTTGTVIGDKSVWHRGIAKEVMALRARFLFLETTLRRLRSGYLVGNLASARAQAAAGYRDIGRWHQAYFRNGAWVDMVLAELRREDWLTANSTPPKT